MADKNYSLLKANPLHASLRFKKIGGNLWSARVGAHYRALAKEHLGTMHWVWIGLHSEYDRLLRGN